MVAPSDLESESSFAGEKFEERAKKGREDREPVITNLVLSSKFFYLPGEEGRGAISFDEY